MKNEKEDFTLEDFFYFGILKPKTWANDSDSNRTSLKFWKL